MKQSINTVQGRAEYVRTELEDKDERWNDSYRTKDGYFIIHEGSEHHVYKVLDKDRLKADGRLVIKDALNRIETMMVSCHNLNEAGVKIDINTQLRCIRTAVGSME